MGRVSGKRLADQEQHQRRDDDLPGGATDVSAETTAKKTDGPPFARRWPSSRPRCCANSPLPVTEPAVAGVGGDLVAYTAAEVSPLRGEHVRVTGGINSGLLGEPGTAEWATSAAATHSGSPRRHRRVRAVARAPGSQLYRPACARSVGDALRLVLGGAIESWAGAHRGCSCGLAVGRSRGFTAGGSVLRGP